MNNTIFEIKVIIRNPKSNDEKKYELKAEFDREEKDYYGNGYHLYITGDNFNEQLLDIRYDETFKENNKMGYLIEWLKKYWTGEKGSWKLKSVICEYIELYNELEDENTNYN